jgi:hypothetical protein
MIDGRLEANLGPFERILYRELDQQIERSCFVGRFGRLRKRE